MTNRQWLALQIGGFFLMVGIILGGCFWIGNILRMWGLL